MRSVLEGMISVPESIDPDARRLPPPLPGVAMESVRTLGGAPLGPPPGPSTDARILPPRSPEKVAAPPELEAASPPEDDAATDEETGIIRCICSCDDDDGFTIQCDKCFVWQHCACFGMSQSSVPDEYLCEECEPREVNVEYARAHQRRRLQDEARKASARSMRDAATTLHTGAANAAWKAAMGETPQPRRRSNGRTSPMREDETPRAKARRKPAKTRKPSTSLPARIRAGGDDDEFDDEAFEKLEPWQIEYTPLAANIVHSSTVPKLARHAAEWARTPLATAAQPNGTHLAPLAPLRGDEPEEGVRYARLGLAPLGNEHVPILMECASLAECASRTHVRMISEQVTSSFFTNIAHLQPLASEPQKIWAASKTFCRPVMHGLFADAPIAPGAFIAEYRAEVYDAETYRADPINQYSKIGTVKPHVHLLPPPLSLALDARRYGTAVRFVRSSCHPNAVLRPVLHAPPSEPPRLVFGLFALASIPRHHEVTIGWEWDDAHIVHLLPSLVQRPWAVDGRRHDRRAELEAFAQRGEFPYASTILASKFNAVVSVLLGATTCGCFGPSLGGSSTNAFHAKRQNCAVTQMLRVGQGMALLHAAPVKSGAKSKPITLTPLVGARRHWYSDGDIDGLRAKLAATDCIVQRVDEDKLHADVESDAESVDSCATEPYSDDLAYESEAEDPVVAKALDTLDVQHAQTLLPLKKRVEGTRIKAQEPERPKKRSARPSLMPEPSASKRSKVRALLDPSSPVSSDDENASPSKRNGERRELAPLRRDKLSPTLLDERPKIKSPKAPSKATPNGKSPTPTRVPTPPSAPVRMPTPPSAPVRVPTPPSAPARVPTPPGLVAPSPSTPVPMAEELTLPTVPTPPTEPTPPKEPTPPPKEPTPPPPPPKKKLSLAEYKQRLASRRQSAQEVDGDSHSPTSVPSPGVSLASPRTTQASAPSPADASSAPSASPVSFAPTREAVRAVVIPKSPPASPPGAHGAASERASAPASVERAGATVPSERLVAVPSYGRLPPIPMHNRPPMHEKTPERPPERSGERPQEPVERPLFERPVDRSLEPPPDRFLDRSPVDRSVDRSSLGRSPLDRSPVERPPPIPPPDVPAPSDARPQWPEPRPLSQPTPSTFSKMPTASPMSEKFAYEPPPPGPPPPGPPPPMPPTLRAAQPRESGWAARGARRGFVRGGWRPV